MLKRNGKVRVCLLKTTRTVQIRLPKNPYKSFKRITFKLILVKIEAVENMPLVLNLMSLNLLNVFL